MTNRKRPCKLELTVEADSQVDTLDAVREALAHWEIHGPGIRGVNGGANWSYRYDFADRSLRIVPKGEDSLPTERE